MSNQPPGFPVGGISRGGLGAEDADTRLRTENEALPAADGEVLALPFEALLAFRKTGGLRFSSRGFLLTKSGWIIPLPGTEGRLRHIGPVRLASLARRLARAGLGRAVLSISRPRPDGFSYELVARVRGRPRWLAFDQGHIPAAQADLVRTLERLLPG